MYDYELPFEAETEAPAREYGPAADTFTCSHGVTFIGAEGEDCEACFLASLEAEAEAMPNGWQDFPSDARFFDEEAQADLALYEESEFGLAMAANREARLAREEASAAASAGLSRLASTLRWAIDVTGGRRWED